MKPLTLLFALLLNSLAFIQVLAQKTFITFPVCKVEKATVPLGETAYKDAAIEAAALKERNRIKVSKAFPPDSASWAYYNADTLLKSPKFLEKKVQLLCLGEKDYRLVPTGSQHPLVYAMYQSYAQHRPLTLSPDMIWLLISQGFAKHVELNTKQLRRRLVGFDGKKVLIVKRNEFFPADPDYWIDIFPEFSNQIALYCGKELTNTMTARFSTTGAAEAAAFQVSLMDAMCPYFLYVLEVVCGIPEITLEGTPEDWAELETRLANLAQYDLSWWTGELKPILHEFTEASRGNVHAEFWQQMFRIRQVPHGCAPINHINGWVLNFFPYIKDNRNPWITELEAVQAYTSAVEKVESFRQSGEVERLRKENTDEAWGILWQNNSEPLPTKFNLPVVELDILSSGLAKADVLLNNNGLMSMIEFQAGFVGIRQDPRTLSLRPEISWLVVDTKDEPTKEDLDLYEKSRRFLESARK